MQQVVRIEDIESLLDNYKELIVRKNDQNNLEVISMDEYIDNDDFELDDEIEEKLLKSEEDIRNGRIRDAVEVFKELEAKYGF